MTKRKKQNWDDVPWTPFVEIEPPFAEGPGAGGPRPANARWMANSIYMVLVQVPQDVAPFGLVVQLSITTHDQQPRHDWREMQRIKNELVGPTVEAVELYPSENRLVDNANWYHLFCFPRLPMRSGRLPFGEHTRFVSEGTVPGFNKSGEGFRQREFRPEFRPPDLHRGDEALELGPDDKPCGRCPHDGSAVVFRAGEQGVRRIDDAPVAVSYGECAEKRHAFLVVTKDDPPGSGGE